MRRTAAIRRGGTGTATKAKGKGTPIAPVEPPPDLSVGPCVTIEDRLTRIREIGRKVEEHVQAVTTIEALPGTSAESREKAVALFLERLVVLEKALGKTLEELRLG
jgi:hypothetical protein